MSNRSASGKRLRASALDPATTNATVKRFRGLVASNTADAECNAPPDTRSEMSVIGSGLPVVLGSMAPQHLLSDSECRVFVLMPFLLSALFFQKGPLSLLLLTIGPRFPETLKRQVTGTDGTHYHQA
jgi:hypothetical protein